ncbi:angio-associated migratory cell protein [Abrus precatorius]|uniref:Angio-associated migratory cell protein n=1 Tax=Abrus precatorius TaxID=3816 RepID=A0A8B8MEC1_ABRPR|nr:angio-associated migratory cell protein [Abrus precatorius]
MNAPDPVVPPLHDDEDDNNDVFLDDHDIIHEYVMDGEDLPDAEDGSESEHEEGDDDDFVHKFTGHTGELYSVACSPTDTTLVATGGSDDRGFLWKIGEGDWAFELQGHEESVSSLAFSYDGHRLASGSLDGIIKVWDVSANWEARQLEGPGGGIEWLRWHPRGHILLAGSEDFTVWMWNTDSAIVLNTFVGHGSSVTCGDFTPDGKIICTGSDDATLRIWNPRSAENIHVVRGHPYHTEGLTCLAINSTSTLALTGSKDGSVHIVNITTGRVVDNNALASHTDSIECVGFAPSDSWAASGGMDKKLMIWDIEHFLPRGTCEHEEGVTCLAWLGASYVATGCVDGKVRLWDSRSGECVKTFNGHSDAIQSLSVSANRDYLVSASLDETACVFEVGNFR